MKNSLGNELPDDINAIALQRLNEYPTPYISEFIEMAFHWRFTPEKSIWSDVDLGKYDSFYKFHKMHQYADWKETIDNYVEKEIKRDGIIIKNIGGGIPSIIESGSSGTIPEPIVNNNKLGIARAGGSLPNAAAGGLNANIGTANAGSSGESPKDGTKVVFNDLQWSPVEDDHALGRTIRSKHKPKSVWTSLINNLLVVLICIVIGLILQQLIIYSFMMFTKGYVYKDITSIIIGTGILILMISPTVYHIAQFIANFTYKKRYSQV